MVLYHFRFHIDHLTEPEVGELINFTRSNSVVDIMVQEFASASERPHIHSVICPIKTISTFRQKLLKEFPKIKGNRYYSLEELKKPKEHMYAYCCKGENDETQPKVILTRIDTKTFHAQYWEVNKSLKTDETGKVKKERTLTWIQDVKKEFLEKYPLEIDILANPVECMWKPTETEQARYVESKKILLSFIMKKLGRSVKIVDDNIISRIFKGIHNSLIQDGDHTQKYTDYLFGKLGL